MGIGYLYSAADAKYTVRYGHKSKLLLLLTSLLYLDTTQSKQPSVQALLPLAHPSTSIGTPAVEANCIRSHKFLRQTDRPRSAPAVSEQLLNRQK